MKLYIPEIGDELKLTENWFFKLHAEYRNVDLAAMFGYYYTGNSGWVFESTLAQIRERDYEVKYPDRSSFNSYDEFNKLCKIAEDNCPEYNKYWEDYRIWHEKCEEIGKQFIDIMLPAGTTIKVDRIYIRKGSSDYSSITFYAKGLGTVLVKPAYTWGKKRNKTSLRFWAKLSDCNNIEFDNITKK